MVLHKDEELTGDKPADLWDALNGEKYYIKELPNGNKTVNFSE